MKIDSDALRTLIAVIDEGSLDRAARTLQVTPSAVSQRIRSLEHDAGRALLVRSKPVRTTESGERMLRLARQVALLESETSADLGLAAERDAPVIPLTVNADSLATWLLPALAQLPDLRFHLTVDDQDHSVARLRDGSAMAAVTSDSSPVQGCTIVPLGAMRYRAVASAAFVDRWFADGVTDAALAAAPMVVFDGRDAMQDRYLQLRLGDAPVGPPRYRVPASADFVRATALGLGWGMVPDLQSDPLVESGELQLLDRRRWIDVPLYVQYWSIRSRLLDDLAQALLAAAASALRRP